jgi:hypothetical protein
VSEQASTRAILCSGAGSFELAHITLTHGTYLADPLDRSRSLLEGGSEIADRK